MVKVCCVKHCNNRSTRESDRGYFNIPGSPTKSIDNDVNRLTALRRAKWIDAIRGPNANTAGQALFSNYVCSDHFQSGKPAEIEDDTDIDWVPTLVMGHERLGKVNIDYSVADEVEDTDGNRWRTWEMFVRRIMDYIKSGSFQEDLTKSEQRAILKAAKTYYLEGGVLFHQRAGKPLKVVMLETEHKAIIRQFHFSESGIHSIHWGINATMDRITSKFFWRGIKQDVVQYIGQCCGNQKLKDATKSPASKALDDFCSSVSDDETSKDEGLSVVSESMTASNAIQKIADTISKQKSSTPSTRSRSHDDSKQQTRSMDSKAQKPPAVETEKPGPEESKEVKAETSDKQEPEEVLILDENEGTFVTVNRNLVEVEPTPKADIISKVPLIDLTSKVPLIDLTSSVAAPTEELASTQTVIVRNPSYKPSSANESISDGLSASATILKLVNNATKEKAENRMLKSQGLNAWPKQKMNPRQEILPKSPVSALSIGAKSPAKIDLDTKAPAMKIYRSFAWSLYNIGLKMVRQQVYKELVEIQELKDEQKRLDEGEQRQLEKLKGYYMDLRQKNRYLMTPGKRCRCGYRVTSRQELEIHLEYGHGWESGRYDCCLCKFTSKAFALFSSHMIKEHGRKARFQQPLAAFVCPFCPFEHRHNTKKKLLRHIANCERNFQLDFNLAVRAIDSDIPILAPPKPVPTPASEVASSVAQTTNSKSQASKNQRSLLKTPSSAEGSALAVSTNSDGNLPSKSVQQSVIHIKAIAHEICEICGGFTKDRASLISHLRAAHNVDIYSVCGKISDLPIVCMSCPERFWTPIGLERHVALQHSGATPDPITKAVISVCPLCKRTRLTDVMLHLAQQHRVTLLDMFTVRYCALCLVELHSEKAFENHMITRHSALYPRRSVLLDSIRLLEQARPNTSRPASAILLALVSRNKYKYGPSRAPLQMYSCPICRCHYGSLDDLTSHFERIHPLKCCRCEYRCKSAEVLWMHFRSEHEAMDMCPICERDVPFGLGNIEHFEKCHMKSCSVALSELSEEIEELQGKGQFGGYVLGKRHHHPSSLSDGSEADTVSCDEATEPKSQKMDDPDDSLNDLDALETC